MPSLRELNPEEVLMLVSGLVSISSKLFSLEVSLILQLKIFEFIFYLIRKAISPIYTHNIWSIREDAMCDDCCDKCLSSARGSNHRDFKQVKGGGRTQSNT